MSNDKGREHFVKTEMEQRKKEEERRAKEKEKEGVTFKPDKKFIKEINKKKDHKTYIGDEEYKRFTDEN